MRRYNPWAGLDLMAQDAKRITRCKRCSEQIVWLKAKSGKSYPVNFNGLADVLKADFHKCKGV